MSPLKKPLFEVIQEENIKTIHELYTKHPEVWTKYTMYKVNGLETPNPHKATECCIFGAAVLLNQTDKLANSLEFWGYDSAADINDTPSTILADIINFCERFGL